MLFNSLTPKAPFIFSLLTGFTIANQETSDIASYRLIHLHVADDFTILHYLFAAGYVADQVYLRLYAHKRQQLIDFLSESRGVWEMGSLHGVLFERHAHPNLSKRGSLSSPQIA